MALDEVSAITSMLDNVYTESRDILVFYKSTNVTEQDRGRLRAIIKILQKLDDEISLEALEEQIKQADSSDEELDQLISDSLGPVEQRTPMRTFDDHPLCAHSPYVKPPRPPGTGQDDYSFGISGLHLG